MGFEVSLVGVAHGLFLMQPIVWLKRIQGAKQLVFELLDDLCSNVAANIEGGIPDELQQQRFAHVSKPELGPRGGSLVRLFELCLFVFGHVTPVEGNLLELE